MDKETFQPLKTNQESNDHESLFTHAEYCSEKYNLVLHIFMLSGTLSK